MKKILILGAGGMLGHQLWSTLGSRFSETYGVLHQSAATYPLDSRFKKYFDQIDVTRPDQLNKIISQVEPDVILNCAAITKRRICRENLPETILLNSWFPHHLARLSKNYKFRLIHFSTDCVFNGNSTGNYPESASPNADDPYGRTKGLGDPNFLDPETDALVLRTSLIGPELSHPSELLGWFLSQKGKQIRGFSNAVFSGLTTVVFSELISEIIEKHTQLKGLYHVASDPIDKFTLLNLINKKLDLGIGIHEDPSFHCNRSLNGTLFQKTTGWVAPSWEEMIKNLDIEPHSK